MYKDLYRGKKDNGLDDFYKGTAIYLCLSLRILLLIYNIVSLRQWWIFVICTWYIFRLPFMASMLQGELFLSVSFVSLASDPKTHVLPGLLWEITCYYSCLKLVSITGPIHSIFQIKLLSFHTSEEQFHPAPVWFAFPHHIVGIPP